MATSADELLSEFRESNFAPAGEWWQEFLVGLSFEYGGTRRADAVVVTSRQPTADIRREETAWFRNQLESNWLQGDQVALIEVKAAGDKDSWKALGQLQIYQKLVEIDWNADVENRIILADASVPGKDSEQLLKHHFENIELYVFENGQFR